MPQIIEVPGHGQVEFPDGMSDEDIVAAIQKNSAPAAPAAPAERPASAGDIALGSIPGRMALGASQIITGPLQLGANIGDKISEAIGNEPVVGKAINATLSALEESKRRGMKARGTEGYDFAGLAGNILSGGVAMKGITPAVTTMKRIAQGAGVGAGFGAATPVTDGGDNFFAEKGAQTATGAVIGTALPATTALTKGAYNFVKDVKDLFTEQGAKNIATRFTREIIGDGDLQPVVDKLRNVKQLVPGSEPTAAEAVVGLPGGSPVAASQATTFKTAGGVSADAGRRLLDQEAARTAASKALDAQTGPMRQAALDAANVKGVDANTVVNRITYLQNQPGKRASTIVQKVLENVKTKLDDLSFAQGGKIDANDLYTIRKEIGTVIKTYSKETANWDKKLSAGLQADVQHAIDDAIEKAGGTGWKVYLARYAQGRGAIDADIERSKEALKPLQRTILSGGQNVTSDVTAHIPQLLSRPAMIVNAVLRYMGANVEPRVDAIMAQRFLTPSLLADAIEKSPQSTRQRIIQEFWQQYGRAVTTGAPVEAAAKAEGQ